jgi:TfoX/Sxy family transcriptional regulator of competence genes
MGRLKQFEKDKTTIGLVEFQKQWGKKGLFHRRVMSGCFANNVLSYRY